MFLELHCDFRHSRSHDGPMPPPLSIVMPTVPFIRNLEQSAIRNPKSQQIYTEIRPPGSSTIGSAAVCERTRSAHAAASCAIGGQVL